MDYAVLAIFALVYLGMLLGSFPGLALDRTGIALLGAIALVALGKLSLREAEAAVDLPTLALLFGLMVLSAQLRLGGFYGRVTARLAEAALRPPLLLAALVGVTGLLSAVLANDVVCLATTPVLLLGCRRRGLNPLPFLLGLAAASNIGSAATLIGNPQNMLIGQRLRLGFSAYLGDALLPSLLGLGALWGILILLYRGRWALAAAGGVNESASADLLAGRRREDLPFDAWQTAKGLAVAALLVAAFLFTPWPRELLALGAAGVLLTSRRLATREILALVDWQLLALFSGLFVVNAAFAGSGWLPAALAALRGTGLDPAALPVLFGLSAVLSNLVSNVPAAMLLLPAATHPLGGAVLALSSTLAGNFILVGSIANLIVVDQAARLGQPLSGREHARAGIPVTLATLAIAALWLWLRAA